MHPQGPHWPSTHLSLYFEDIQVLNVASYIQILMYFYCYLLNSVSGKSVAQLSYPSLP